MGKNSTIEWTHHTFNPWWGCFKISPACENCYAEKWSKRLGKKLWGANAERLFFTEKHWQEPLRWNREATKSKTRKRVFCASMADVFENRDDLDIWRNKLWALIDQTPNLDWLLLTKRTENIEKLSPWNANWPDNIWIGTTIENQEIADEKIPELLKHPAKVRFISCEPLLSKLDISKWLCLNSRINLNTQCINWVIVGGESGAKARPVHPDWIRNIKNQCIKAGIPFHFKQWGGWCPIEEADISKRKAIKLNSGKGNIATLVKKGKKAAGRKFDGHTWDGFPEIN